MWCGVRMKNWASFLRTEESSMQTLIELSPVATNALILVYYLFNYPGLGKLMYWVGAGILNVGIYIMKG